VPVGGGGFSAGVASAIKLRLPNARVIGVEPTTAPKLSSARAAGKPVKIPKSNGLADGLLAVEVGTLTFAHHQKYVDDVTLLDSVHPVDIVEYTQADYNVSRYDRGLRADKGPGAVSSPD